MKAKDLANEIFKISWNYMNVLGYIVNTIKDNCLWLQLVSLKIFVFPIFLTSRAMTT